MNHPALFKMVIDAGLRDQLARATGNTLEIVSARAAYLAYQECFRVVEQEENNRVKRDMEKLDAMVQRLSVEISNLTMIDTPLPFCVARVSDIEAVFRRARQSIGLPSISFKK